MTATVNAVREAMKSGRENPARDFEVSKGRLTRPHLPSGPDRLARSRTRSRSTSTPPPQRSSWRAASKAVGDVWETASIDRSAAIRIVGRADATFGKHFGRGSP